MKKDYKTDDQLLRALRRSIALGHVIQLPDGSYQLTELGMAHVLGLRKRTLQ